jgi:homoserine dehydrogenase
VVVIERTEGDPVVLKGKGAGRWPTTESVIGDILELSRFGNVCTRRAAVRAG